MVSVRTIYGIGVNDAGYVVAPIIDGKQVMCPYYSTWSSMFFRCYSQTNLKNNPCYIGCSVSDKWHKFSDFKLWMESQDWRGKVLDKDLLVFGNKTYSPETCVFIDERVNLFIADKNRGKYLNGVYLCKTTGKFRGRVHNLEGKAVCLGRFLLEDDAHSAWIKAKKQFAEQLAAMQSDIRVAKALTERYNHYGFS